MDNYSSEEDYKLPQTKSKPKEQDDYDDDFEEQKQNNNKNRKQQNKSPKVAMSSSKDKKRFSPKLNQKGSNKDRQESDQVYENDFEQGPSHRNLPPTSPHEKSASLSTTKPATKSTHLSSPPHPLTKKPSTSLPPPQSKYLNYLNTQFPHTKEEIASFPHEKINRLNEKLRGYIKRVNDELTDLISENMRVMKVGMMEKQQNGGGSSKTENKTVEDTVTLLAEQLKNGQTYLSTLQKQHQNLTHQHAKLTNPSHQPPTQLQIQQLLSRIKQHTKEITQLKFNMHQEGNKLTEEVNYGDRVNQLKGKLIIATKEEEKQAERLERANKNWEDLTRKTPEIEALLERLMEQARVENISLNLNPGDRKKQQRCQQLRKKLLTSKAHTSKSLTLTQTKTSIITKDLTHLTTQLTQIEKRFTLIDTQLKSTQQSSVQLIEEARYRDLQPYVQTHLEFIYRNIKEGNPLATGMVGGVRTGSKDKGVGGKKYTSVKGFVRSQSEAELKPVFHIGKKATLEGKTNKAREGLKLGDKPPSSSEQHQRVWKDSPAKNQPKNHPTHQPDPKSSATTTSVQQPNSSKPFIIRKSQNVSASPTSGQLSKKPKQIVTIPPSSIPPATNKQQHQQKENSKSPSTTALLGPKMKFKKQQTIETIREDVVISEKDSNGMISKQQSHQEEEVDNTSNSKPHFKIKKAAKVIVEIPDQDLYLFPPGTAKDIKAGSIAARTVDSLLAGQVKEQAVKQQPIITTTNNTQKGPNFKLSSKKNSTDGKPIGNTIELRMSLEHDTNKNDNTFLTNLDGHVEAKSQQKQDKVEAVEEDVGLNVGGRRQVQRKIQRKQEDAYVG